MNPRVHRTLSLTVTLLGLALLIMMIVVEGEFGALPLALLVGGGIWYGIARLRS